ncbi:MAG: hypothetical protein HQL75_06445 [Magnetococcales bacterium]|nr:hypothetical protein [Magnetococcales bacterium]
MAAQDIIAAWLTDGTLRREELEALFVAFGGYGAAVVRDDGEIHIYGSTQCACADEMASDHELSEFVQWITLRASKDGMIGSG